MRPLRISWCYIAIVLTLCYSAAANGQNTPGADSAVQIPEVVITGFQPNDPRFTSLNIEPYRLDAMNEKSPFNLSDALAKLPGISQITTGNGISKPVIRGLYGNRILFLLSGLRFDNQQWQDEHGLGLSQIGIDRVEVIKGPASLLYGSEALGGVVNIIEETPVKMGRTADAGIRLFSNSMGTLTDAGIQSKNKAYWWRLRLGAENHADYADGSGNRVLNSRNRGAYLKAGFGWEKKKWKQDNSYNFSYNQYGFIMDDLPGFFDADHRWSRAMDGPHHNVMLHILNSQNSVNLRHSLLKINGGFQSNLRMEDEGGGQISLKMHLLSGLQSLRWEKVFSKRITFLCNQQFTFTNNTNYGGRIIIPDANYAEGNLSGYVRYSLPKILFEAGLGLAQKHFRTFRTGTLNIPGEQIQPFTKNTLTGNGMLGISWNPSKRVTLKWNASTGFRAPNLAELSSNGVHEGVYRYEVGNPKLRNEKNLNNDINLEINGRRFFTNVSLYYNHISDYIYLAPTPDTFFLFPVYRFRQQNAAIYGGEFVLQLLPDKRKQFALKETVSYTVGVLQDKGFLPFIPAFRSSSSLRWQSISNQQKPKWFAEPEFQWVAAQNNAAIFESPTPSYSLINLHCGYETPSIRKNAWNLGLSVTNALNRTYADHLSRLKYYGLNNQGRSFVVSLRKTIH